MSTEGRRRPSRDGLRASAADRASRPLWARVRTASQWAVLVGLAAYAVHQSHYLVFRASYFRLQALRVVGNRVVPEEQIVKMSGVELGMPVFDVDREQIRRRLLLIPRVEDAVVEQRGPSDLTLRVTEKLPVARVYLNGDPLEVSVDGAVLGPVGAAGEGLPWVSGADVVPASGGAGFRLEPRVVQGLREWLPALARSPLAGFQSLSFPEEGKVSVLWRDIEFFLGDAETFRRHAPHLRDLLALQHDRARSFQYIDLRFQDIVAKFLPVN